jgi:hypothetical protein
MKRGTSREITLTGKNLAEPTGVVTTFPCQATIPTDNKNGQDPAKTRVLLQVPADAPLGYHGLRLATKGGMSNLLVFCIDELEEVMHVAGNNSPKLAQPLKFPCVVAGRVDNLQRQYFKISVQAGQRLSFDVLAHRLGSPLDPLLTLYSAQSGEELAHVTDTPGLQNDCRLTYQFKTAGDYHIEVRDLQNRGGPDFSYRFRIGDFPCATAPMPLAIQRGAKTLVNFAGPQVEGVQPVEVTGSTDPLQRYVWVAPKSPNGLHGWPVALALSDYEEKVEQEPNDEPAKANRVAVPGGITGRFDKYGDKDQFVFSAKKGQKFLLQGYSMQLYSPALLYMVLRDAKGTELAKTNAEANAPLDKRIDFTAPADGDYWVELQHLNYLGGPSEVYRLTITPKESEFNLSLSLDRWDMAPAEALVLPLQVNRGGYAGPIVVSVVSPHPGLTGAVTIPENQKTGALILQAKPDAPVGPYTLRLKAEATTDGRKVTEIVSVAGALSDSLGKLPVPPLHLSDQIAVAIKPRPPFQLLVQTPFVDAVPGLGLPVTITIKRDPGFDGPVDILPPQGLPGPAKPPAIKPIPKGQDKTTVVVPIDPKTPAGKHFLQFTGKSKIENKEVYANGPPTELTVGPPFALLVEAPTLMLKQGDKLKVKVSVTRKGGYDGPVEVELTKLPAKVTSSKVTLAKGQNSAELEVTAAPDAAVGEKKDVQALGKAPAAGNQQNSSPNITISIIKK